jgi:hypothetical protein
VQLGGEVDAGKQPGECLGSINTQSVVTFNWLGKAYFLQVFFYSNDDATLVIRTDAFFYAGNSAFTLTADDEVVLMIDGVTTLTRGMPDSRPSP